MPKDQRMPKEDGHQPPDETNSENWRTKLDQIGGKQR